MAISKKIRVEWAGMGPRFDLQFEIVKSLASSMRKVDIYRPDLGKSAKWQNKTKFKPNACFEKIPHEQSKHLMFPDGSSKPEPN